jgi:extracellular factor (EF) 3-hydroxypalmitic acid methyl ester biosynthesis protein
VTELLLQSVRETAQALRDGLNRSLAECADVTVVEHSAFLERPVGELMSQCLETLAATGCVGPTNQLPSQVLWNIAGDLLRHGELQLRAREKPRGYAGDDVLLRSIFAGEVAWHPLGQVFDRYFLQQDAPRAVNHRTIIAAKQCEEVLFAANAEVGCHIAVIGAGPALEVEQALRQWAANSECLRRDYPRGIVRITLLDLDEMALLTARERLSRIAPDIELVTLRENLFRIGRQSIRALPLIDSDMIICLGLLDYLNAVDASSLLRVCYQSLRPGGRMIFGNFAPQCKARTYMEWIGNWYLTYRTEAEFMAIAHSAGIDEQHFRITSLVDGACLLLDARRA